MKASQHDPAGVLAYIALIFGVLSLNLLSLGRIDILLSAPFGSLMVFSGVISSLAAITLLYRSARLQDNLRPRYVRVGR